MRAEPSIGLLLPGRVAIRSVGDTRTRVETFDPGIMVSITGNPGLQVAAAPARTRLTAALQSLEQPPPQQ